jgi:hypothetical protein
VAVLFLATLSGQERQIARITFFGQGGFDVAAVRAALPLREGSLVPFGLIEGAAADEAARLRQRLDEAVMRIVGGGPTDVATVCCDSSGRLLIYIGLPARSLRTVQYNPPPTGSDRVPVDVEQVHEQLNELLFKAVLDGRAAEDRSEGYPLARENPTLRAKQLQWRETVRRHERTLLAVVRSAGDAAQRRIAAAALGYLRPSDSQVAALVSASFDADEDVRNDAVRALAVLLTGKPELSRRVPAERFIDLLSSGTWSDRNKGLAVIEAIVVHDDARLLRDLRARATAALVDMAQWPPLHARSARVILAHMAGIPEREIDAVVDEEPPKTLLQKFRDAK